MSTPKRARCTILHIGAFDLASYGDQLYPLVAAHELGRRLDDVEVLPFGPVGPPGDGLADAGRCWALGPWSEERAAALARKADVVLCGGGEIVQGDGTTYTSFYGIDGLDAEALRIDRWFLEGLGAAEQQCPVVWHSPGVPSELDPATAERLQDSLAHRSMVAVRDERSRRLLDDAGVDRMIEVVPDSALLLPRVLPSSQLEEERDRLRASGWYPAPTDGDSTEILVVQGNHTMTDLVDDLAAALDALPPEVHVVTVAVSPCHNDHLFAEALGEKLERPTWHVPTTSLEGVAAAIASADCFLGVSLHGAITAIAYGRPTVTYDPFRQAKLASFLDVAGVPERRATDPGHAVTLAAELASKHAKGELEAQLPQLAELQDRIDAHFDRVAELAAGRVEARTEPLEPVAWTDTGNAQHVALRHLPLDVAPAPQTTPAALRLPDVEPTPDELAAALTTAAATRMARREADQATARELAELRRQNQDLRGAMAHLEGLTAEQQRQLSQIDLSEKPRPRGGRHLPATLLHHLAHTFRR